MDRIEKTKLLPALERGYKREALNLQGEWMGQRINCAAWVDYEVLVERSLRIEADDINVVGLWGALGEDMLEGYGEDGPDAMPPYFAYLYRCAQRAAAGHEYALAVSELAEWRDSQDWCGGRDFAGNSHQMTVLRPMRRAAADRSRHDGIEWHAEMLGAKALRPTRHGDDLQVGSTWTEPAHSRGRSRMSRTEAAGHRVLAVTLAPLAVVLLVALWAGVL